MFNHSILHPNTMLNQYGQHFSSTNTSG